MTDQLLSNTPPSRFSFLKTKRAIAIGVGMAIIAVGAIAWYVSYNSQFAAPQANAEPEQFTMPLGSGDFKNLQEYDGLAGSRNFQRGALYEMGCDSGGASQRTDCRYSRQPAWVERRCRK